MAKEEINQQPASFIPVIGKNGAIEYRTIFTPLPPDTTHPFLRFLQDNRDVYGYLHRYAEPPERDLAPVEQKAHLGITTMIGLGVGEESPFQSLTETTDIVLHFLSDSQQAATKAAFLQNEFGMRHVEAGFVEYPLRESQQFGYHLFTKATGIYQRLQGAEVPQEGPTWFDMRVLNAYESLLADNRPTTPHNILTHLGTHPTDKAAIMNSLRKLETLGEITRPSPRRRAQTAAEKRTDNAQVLVIPKEKSSTRRKVKRKSLIA